MTINNQLSLEKISYNTLAIPNTYLETIQEVVFRVTELAIIILSSIPPSELGKCTQINKTLRGAVYLLKGLRTTVFLERAKLTVVYVEDSYIREASIAKIAQLEVTLSLKEAKKTLQKITEFKNCPHVLDNAYQAFTEIVKKELENGQLEDAVQTANELWLSSQKLKAWLMIANHKKTEDNIKKCLEVKKEIRIEEEAAFANLQFWKVFKEEKYLSKATNKAVAINPLERIKFWLEVSKIDGEKIQEAKNQISLMFNRLHSSEKEEILAYFDVAIDFAKVHPDDEFMEKIKAEIKTIKTPSTQLEIWRRVCKAEPEVENNFKEAISLTRHAKHKITEVEIWIEFFELTKKIEYLNNAVKLADQLELQEWKNSSWFKVVRAKSEHGLIDEAKKDAENIKEDLYYKALAWIAIWKGEQTSENLQNAISLIISNKKRHRADLWIEMAKAEN